MGIARERNRVSRAGLVVVTVVLIVGGIATDVRAHAGDGDTGKIHACVSRKGGKVRFVAADASLTCKKNEDALHFNVQGPAGQPGTTGPPGRAGQSGLTPLASGETVSGVWGGSVTAADGGQAYRAFAAFPIPLAADIAMGNQKYVSGSSATNCPGPGQAAPGFLCVYQGFKENADIPLDFAIFDPSLLDDAPLGGAGASRYGFGILLRSTTSGLSALSGTFSVTAP